ncbi:hypothetical protein S101359_04012 [Bacillus atrophaeus]|nr:hypothetical protein S101359_04012 [Bacillus atrophaeus]
MKRLLKTFNPDCNFTVLMIEQKFLTLKKNVEYRWEKYHRKILIDKHR